MGRKYGGAYRDPAYRAAQAKLKAHARKHGAVCWLCHHPIDMTLPARDPWSFSADHVDALADGGGAASSLRPSHYRCNSSRGGKTGSGHRHTWADRRREPHPGRITKH